MELYYDSEFLENGVTIKFLSIGMIAEDGRELYRITNNMNTIIAAARDHWLKENVLSSFPLVHPIDPAYPVWDESHPDFYAINNQTTIALDIHKFIAETYNPSLWAWFGAYDHVLLAQLFGKMIHLPQSIPMYTNDLMTEVERLGRPYVPQMPGRTGHNALSDAKEVMWRRQWLKEYERNKNVKQV